MLSRGKGASIFDAVNLKEADFGAVDKELLTAKDKEGFTLLHHASRCNKVDEVIWLLDKGVEIDALGNYGLTALNIAVRYDLSVISKGIIVTCKILFDFNRTLIFIFLLSFHKQNPGYGWPFFVVESRL